MAYNLPFSPVYAGPVVALIAGILILIQPRLLNYIVARGKERAILAAILFGCPVQRWFLQPAIRHLQFANESSLP